MSSPSDKNGWIKPEAVLDGDIDRRIMNGHLSEFVSKYVHIGDRLKLAGGYATFPYSKGRVLRWYNDRLPYIEQDGMTIPVDHIKCGAVKKGAGFEDSDKLRYVWDDQEMLVGDFRQVTDWPYIEVDHITETHEVRIDEIEKIVTEDDPETYGSPYGIPSDFEWAVGKLVKPIGRLSPFEVRSVEWADYNGQRRPRYVTNLVIDDARYWWCDEFIDRFGPRIKGR
jgi:hypothetical protein